MDFRYRLADEKDEKIIKKMAYGRKRSSLYVGADNAEDLQRALSSGHLLEQDIWDRQETFPVLIAEEFNTDRILGFMIFDLDVEDELFPRFHTVIYDYHVEPDAPFEEIMQGFTEHAEVFSQENENHQILVNLDIYDEKGRDFFIKSNFYQILCRIYKPVEQHHLETHLQGNYTFRPALEKDRDFILVLISQNTRYTIPPGLEEESDQYQQANYASYSAINIESDPSLIFYIIEEKAAKRSAGFIAFLLDGLDSITAEKTAYLFDMGVHREFWGRYATQRLVREGEHVLAERGCKYLYADVLVNNPRALKTAKKSLGFMDHSVQLARKVEK